MARIGIGFFMGGRERDGIGWFMTRLLGHLLKAESPHRFIAFTDLAAGAVRDEFGHPPHLEVVSFRLPIYTVWEQVGLPIAMMMARLDLFHAPLGLPIACPVPAIATLHDLCFLVLPETFTPRMRAYFRVALPASARRAKMVLTISEASKRALMERFGVPAAKIRVVPAAVAEEFVPVTDAGKLRGVLARYGLPAEFILYVGTLEPRKNVVRLIQACQLLWQERRLELPLVIVGRRGWLSESIFDTVREGGSGARIIFPGYVAREDLPALYSAARVFVYPSLCEGFGMPPLEAMACGTAVVASTSTSLPEVLGDAALLVNPLDVDALAQAIEAVVRDAALRERLRAAGLARARTFRWADSASRVLELYDTVLAARSGVRNDA